MATDYKAMMLDQCFKMEHIENEHRRYAGEGYVPGSRPMAQKAATIDRRIQDVRTYLEGGGKPGGAAKAIWAAFELGRAAGEFPKLLKSVGGGEKHAEKTRTPAEQIRLVWNVVQKYRREWKNSTRFSVDLCLHDHYVEMGCTSYSVAHKRYNLARKRYSKST